MRQLKQLSLAVVLALVLGTSAMAGIITTPPAPDPPPPPDPITFTGTIETPPSAEAEPNDPTVELALIVLHTVLSVF